MLLIMLTNLLLVMPSLRMVPLANTMTNYSIFQCQYIRGLFVEQGNRSCAPYDCWHSQLLDLSRNSLIDIFNDYKARIAQGKCDKCAYPGVEDFRPVFQMYYHWILEFVALHHQRVRNKACEFQDKATITTNDFPNEVYSSDHSPGNFQRFDHGKMEYASISFKLNKYEDQTAAIEKFEHLMFDDRKYNLFEAWNGTTYRYTLAKAFGCTLTIRNNVTGFTTIKERVSNARVAFLACVFAFQRLENESDIPKSCVQHQAVYDDRTKLCYYPQFQKNTADDIPCQFYYNISNGAIFPKCRQKPPRIWSKNDAPNPRHQKIDIKISNSNIIELEVATGIINIKGVQRKGNENNLEKIAGATANYNSENSFADFIEEDGGQLVSEDSEETVIDESENIIEYDEPIDYQVEANNTQMPKMPLRKEGYSYARTTTSTSRARSHLYIRTTSSPSRKGGHFNCTWTIVLSTRKAFTATLGIFSKNNSLRSDSITELAPRSTAAETMALTSIRTKAELSAQNRDNLNFNVDDNTRDRIEENISANIFRNKSSYRIRMFHTYTNEAHSFQIRRTTSISGALFLFILTENVLVLR